INLSTSYSLIRVYVRKNQGTKLQVTQKRRIHINQKSKLYHILSGQIKLICSIKTDTTMFLLSGSASHVFKSQRDPTKQKLNPGSQKFTSKVSNFKLFQDLSIL
ncbi:hypothetical protein PanWU01x14_301660, partial [Parasponia andersonii]